MHYSGLHSACTVTLADYELANIRLGLRWHHQAHAQLLVEQGDQLCRLVCQVHLVLLLCNECSYTRKHRYLRNMRISIWSS